MWTQFLFLVPALGPVMQIHNSPHLAYEGAMAWAVISILLCVHHRRFRGVELLKTLVFGSHRVVHLPVQCRPHVRVFHDRICIFDLAIVWVLIVFALLIRHLTVVDGADEAPHTHLLRLLRAFGR